MLCAYRLRLAPLHASVRASHFLKRKYESMQGLCLPAVAVSALLDCSLARQANLAGKPGATTPRQASRQRSLDCRGPHDEQVARLKSCGMQITDDAAAKACLARIGYVRLSEYWYPHLKPTVQDSTLHVDLTAMPRRHVKSDTFKQGTKFSDVLSSKFSTRNFG